MLDVSNLRKTFTLAVGAPALDGVSFTVQPGQFYTLLGPSGCGKTTTLRSVAGLEQPDSGRIIINGRPVFDPTHNVFVAPNRRRIGMVFQSYAIWPHMDVYENIAFPLRVGGKRFPEETVRAKVRKALEMVQMTEFERRPASRLSGGQQQRLAIARALVMEPEVLLLDEPLSNLDAMLRETMRLELRRLQQAAGITTIYVTHDQNEALALSDLVAVMHNGRIVQQGDVKTIYRRPANRFVAEFIGTTNLLAGTSRGISADRTGGVDYQGITLHCTAPVGSAAGLPVLVSVRPESIRMTAAGAGDTNGASQNALRGRITEQLFLGSVADSLVNIGMHTLRVWNRPDDVLTVGTDVLLTFAAEDSIIVPD